MKTAYFIFGFLWHAAISSLNQDLMGKEKYLKAVDLLWIDSSITLPLAIVVIVVTSFWILMDSVFGKDSK